MGRPRKSSAKTSEQREAEMINLAMELSEQKLRDGTAPAPLVMMFAKAGLKRQQLEDSKLESEVHMLRAKVADMERAGQSNEKLDRVFRALRTYQGMPVDPDEEQYEDDY